MKGNFWVVSPNVENNHKEQANWLSAIVNYRRAIIGWSAEDALGKVFADHVQIGDIVLIAQGANWNKKLFLCGTVAGDCKEEHLPSTSRAALNRPLTDCIGDSVLQSIGLNFNGATQGMRKQIPAIYRLKPEINSVDKDIVERVYMEILKTRNDKFMETLRKALEQKGQVILQGPPGTGKTFTAKDVAENMIFGSVSADKAVQASRLSGSDQFKIVQFHPSYSYEDFVRGITAKAEGTQVTYNAENKTLIEFALKAQKNLEDVDKQPDQVSREQWVMNELELFADSVEEVITQQGQFALNNTVSVFEVDKDAFRYGGADWNLANKHRMKFADIALAYLHNAQSRKDIKAVPGISGRAIQHSSYDLLMLSKFRDFLDNRPPFVPGSEVPQLKNYVLVIDEINRANLPAVLGELIYALEYRGQSVESLYDIDGDRTLLLPKNLFIIGTMNTADRSVGHIDYAIRRRFAFVDIEPNSSVLDQVIADDFVKQAAKKLFSAMEALFTDQYLSSDFKKSHVMLGHSYFLAKDMDELMLKLDYEIKPLLREYLQDGIFKTLSMPDGSNEVEHRINRLDDGIV